MAAFPPILGLEPRVLVLGSMPGLASLAERQYYAHPRNSFWWIMSSTFGFSMSLTYEQRSAQLVKHGVAVWDVLYDCDRAGSLDSNIVTPTEVANDFDDFFRQQTLIERVVFNGAAAQRIFKRHCHHLIAQCSHIQWRRLPSTSPAHASMNREQKLLQWRDALMLE